MRIHSFILSIWLIPFVLLVPVACKVSIPNLVSGKVIQGNGVETTQERSIEDFQSIEVPGEIQVQIICNSEPSMTITAEENLLEIIDTTCFNGKLVIRTTESYHSHRPIIIRAKCSKLVRYYGHGASQGTVTEVNSETFDAQLSGASSLVLERGKVGALTGSVSGASRLNAGNLESVSGKVYASGASQALVKVIDDLTAEASGASSVRYRGEPKTLSKDSSGVSSIERVE